MVTKVGDIRERWPLRGHPSLLFDLAPVNAHSFTGFTCDRCPEVLLVAKPTAEYESQGDG